jgi:hypothetical protein
MIFGEGAPKVTFKLSDGSDGDKDLALPRPMRREFEDYEDVILSVGTDADGQSVEVYDGVRYHGTFVWRSHAGNQLQMADVIRVINWRGNGLLLDLMPHDDEPQQRVLCEVVRTSIKPFDGMLTAEDITIEFRGTAVLAKKPNPAFERNINLFEYVAYVVV